MYHYFENKDLKKIKSEEETEASLMKKCLVPFLSNLTNLSYTISQRANPPFYNVKHVILECIRIFQISTQKIEIFSVIFIYLFLFAPLQICFFLIYVTKHF